MTSLLTILFLIWQVTQLSDYSSRSYQRRLFTLVFDPTSPTFLLVPLYLSTILWLTSHSQKLSFSLSPVLNSLLTFLYQNLVLFSNHFLFIKIWLPFLGDLFLRLSHPLSFLNKFLTYTRTVLRLIGIEGGILSLFQKTTYYNGNHSQD